MTATDTQTSDGRAYWERHARNYDRSLRVLAKPVPRMLQLTAEAVRGKERVLEVAAGTGLVTLAIAPHVGELIATDYADAMLLTVRQRVTDAAFSNVRCERANVYALPFRDADFDCVVAANVLHLLPDLEGALEGLKRVLKPGGTLVLPTFCHDETMVSAITSRLLALTGFPGARRFTARSLVGAVAQRGLNVTRVETIPGLIPITFVQSTVEAG